MICFCFAPPLNHHVDAYVALADLNQLVGFCEYGLVPLSESTFSLVTHNGNSVAVEVLL